MQSRPGISRRHMSERSVGSDTFNVEHVRATESPDSVLSARARLPDPQRVKTQPNDSPQALAESRTTASEARYPKVSISLSKSRQQMILSDDRGNRIICHINFVKSVLGVPYTRVGSVENDGTE